jgi:hypothetical protein
VGHCFSGRLRTAKATLIGLIGKSLGCYDMTHPFELSEFEKEEEWRPEEAAILPAATF